MKTENELIALAEQHPDDNVANKAMKELRERFDKTYGWCQDCDGLVCKEKDCCLNRLDIDDVSNSSGDEYYQVYLNGQWIADCFDYCEAETIKKRQKPQN